MLIRLMLHLYGSCRVAYISGRVSLRQKKSAEALLILPVAQRLRLKRQVAVARLDKLFFQLFKRMYCGELRKLIDNILW